MRNLVTAMALAVIGVAASAGTSYAMNAAPLQPQASALIQDVRDGCGRGYRPNQWGRCVPERREYLPAPTFRYGSDYNNNYQPRPRYGYRPQQERRYYDDSNYRGRQVDRRGCPRGKHPGNSGRCVDNY